jgi:McbB family protein
MQLTFSDFDIINLPPNESLIISMTGTSKTESKSLLNVLQELKNRTHLTSQNHNSIKLLPHTNYH